MQTATICPNSSMKYLFVSSQSLLNLHPRVHGLRCTYASFRIVLAVCPTVTLKIGPNISKTKSTDHHVPILCPCKFVCYKFANWPLYISRRHAEVDANGIHTKCNM